MSSKNYSHNPPQNKSINDFTKSLAADVRALLAEVGKLREEKAQLQSEIGELMQLKSKHGARGIGPGGELAIYTPGPPGWGPPVSELATSPPPSDPMEPARPAWRTVTKRAPRKKPTPAAPPQPTSPPPPPNLPAWAQWRPNPLHSPAPMLPSAGSPLPGSPAAAAQAGLFGPPSPPPR
ncbi:hypothetical protein L218DRAFT_1080280 [Marasmius fiardii PR-910]|nr:hypothetical protein L218DRAFT_1080280 [Marasmius fiardii PR-910]